MYNKRDYSKIKYKKMKVQSHKYYICITPFFPLENNWRGAYIFDQVKAIQRNSDYNVVVFKPSNKDGQYDIY